MSEGAALIATERQRQVEQEGWTPEHDDEHDTGEMMSVARAYLYHAHAILDGVKGGYETPPMAWPWDARWWKPADPIRSLVKAGALIAAEIDRLNRQATEGTP